jgi:hypothetical protein
MQAKSYLGHRIREAAIHAQRIVASRKRPSVMILGTIQGPGVSGDLRGSAVGRELRKLGWRATTLPMQLELSQRLRLIRLERPDVILMQQSRHPLNHPRYYPGYPIVFDVDDADIYDPRCTQTVIECCRGSVAVTVGNTFLGTLMREHNPNIHVIWTGSYLPVDWEKRWTAGVGRVVSWVNSGAGTRTAESELLQGILCSLARTTEFEFRIYGADTQRGAEENFSKLLDTKVAIRSFPPMPYRRLARHLRSSDVGLAPLCEEVPFSRGKSFGKVLTYLAAKVAVVASRAVDYPLFFRNGENGILVPNEDVDRWAESIRGLLNDQQARKRMVEAATRDYSERLTVARSAELFDVVLRKAMRGEFGREPAFRA